MQVNKRDYSKVRQARVEGSGWCPLLLAAACWPSLLYRASCLLLVFMLVWLQYPRQFKEGKAIPRGSQPTTWKRQGRGPGCRSTWQRTVHITTGIGEHWLRTITFGRQSQWLHMSAKHCLIKAPRPPNSTSIWGASIQNINVRGRSNLNSNSMVSTNAGPSELHGDSISQDHCLGCNVL